MHKKEIIRMEGNFMDFAERKKQEMEGYLTQTLTFSTSKNILEYSNYIHFL